MVVVGGGGGGVAAGHATSMYTLQMVHMVHIFISRLHMRRGTEQYTHRTSRN